MMTSMPVIVTIINKGLDNTDVLNYGVGGMLCWINGVDDELAMVGNGSFDESNS